MCVGQKYVDCTPCEQAFAIVPTLSEELVISLDSGSDLVIPLDSDPKLVTLADNNGLRSLRPIQKLVKPLDNELNSKFIIALDSESLEPIIPLDSETQNSTLEDSAYEFSLDEELVISLS